MKEPLLCRALSRFFLTLLVTILATNLWAADSINSGKFPLQNLDPIDIVQRSYLGLVSAAMTSAVIFDDLGQGRDLLEELQQEKLLKP